MKTPPPLRLIAQDQDDIAVLSAALQDAITRARDIHYDARRREVTIRLSRFVWEAQQDRARHKGHEGLRRRAILLIPDILAFRAKNIKADKNDPQSAQFINILAVQHLARHDEQDAEGTQRVQVIISEDRALEFEVDALDIRLMDTPSEWRTSRVPDHDDEEEAR